MGRGRLSPLVVVGGSEEVVEDLENDANATSRMADGALTAGGQSARKSPREDAWRVAHKTLYDRSWLLAQPCSRRRGMNITLFEG